MEQYFDTRKAYLYDILENANNAENPADFLRHVKEPTLEVLLWYMLNPACKFALPEGTPPFKTTAHPDGINLRSEVKRLRIFLDPNCNIQGMEKYPNMTQSRREFLFVQLLESVHPNEAKLLVAVKDKKMPFKNLTNKVIKNAWPHIPLDE